ncbi:hypothetical protein [Nocardioides pantholopis]|uniref:hypothetical protein n=1 Tax=Nocardioides pantholopis TaxID=2483798 RepID=UPI000F08DBC2|nr:hypothetical protein [Nocardioides pantholopis]
MQTVDTDLEAWFLHQELVLKVLGPSLSAQISSDLSDTGHVFARARTKSILENAVAAAVRALEVPSLNELHHGSGPSPGQLVWVEQSMHFRGIGEAYYRSKRTGTSHRGTVWGKLATDSNLRFEAEVNASRCTSDTGAHLMSGTSKAFMLAFVRDVNDGLVNLRAVTVGQRLVASGDQAFFGVVGDIAHVWPQQVDQFEGVDFTRGENSDLELMRGVGEEAVKHWFAEIIGQSDVPKDWGGEQFDLWTRFLSVDGTPLRTAFAFKGPAAFHPMRIADLGKNGDQIQRLAESPADLLVVQHCHTITSRVEHMLRTYATSPKNVRRYMLIDGYATAAILKHFEYLP